MNMTIKNFIGEYFFLSNFYKTPIIVDGLEYTNSEAAFQATKCRRTSDRLVFCNLNPLSAKQLGHAFTPRPGWEYVKDMLMYQICLCKFQQSSELRQKLLKTGDAYLEEGNTWNDRYWGTVDGVGENKLGQILMRVREELA